jgi:hypothetical protein
VLAGASLIRAAGRAVNRSASHSQVWSPQADASRFSRRETLPDAERRAILDRYGADWVVVDKKNRHPTDFLRNLRLVFEDDRYALYRVDDSP